MWFRVYSRRNFTNVFSRQVAFVERWNGKVWSVEKTPGGKCIGATCFPLGQGGNNLASVSCAGPSNCTAVGWFTNTSGEQVTLAERWNGKSWTLQSTPATPGGISALNSVSCSGTSTCIAVGSHSNSAYHGEYTTTVTLGERYSS